MRPLAAVLLAAALLSRCAQAPAEEIQPSQLPPYLRPLAGATDIHATRNGDDATIQYKLRACFPANAQMTELAMQIPSYWKPRAESILNPGTPTANSRGWVDYADTSQEPHTTVRHWGGEWEDANGNILSYDFMYRTAAGQSESCELQVSAARYSRETVKTMLAAVPKK